MSQDLSLSLVNNFARFFNSIVLEALPFVVLGVVIAGILEEFIPQEWIKNLFARPSADSKAQERGGLLGFARSALRIHILAVALGALLGLIFPMCECGIIAIMRRLVRKGVPLSVCISYMLAGPIINVVVLLSTYVAFDFPSPEEYVLGGPLSVTLIRAGIGFVVACTTALLVNWQFKRYGNALLHPSLVPKPDAVDNDDNEQPQTKPPFSQRLRAISETALHDFIDIMTFLVLGAVLASVGRMSLENEEVARVTRNLIENGSPAVSIVIMMFVAIVFCLCSEADAFVAANFPRVWPPASKMAFMVLGPMFDLKLYMMYTRIFRHRLIWTIIIGVCVQVFIYMLALHYLFPNHGYPDSYILRGQ